MDAHTPTAAPGPGDASRADVWGPRPKGAPAPERLWFRGPALDGTDPGLPPGALQTRSAPHVLRVARPREGKWEPLSPGRHAGMGPRTRGHKRGWTPRTRTCSCAQRARGTRCRRAPPCSLRCSEVQGGPGELAWHPTAGRAGRTGSRGPASEPPPCGPLGAGGGGPGVPAGQAQSELLCAHRLGREEQLAPGTTHRERRGTRGPLDPSDPRPPSCADTLAGCPHNAGFFLQVWVDGGQGGDTPDRVCPWILLSTQTQLGPAADLMRPEFCHLLAV